MKRFTDTEKWNKNKWFRKLKPTYKLFWLYILDNCDNVGVWEEDIELAELLIGGKITIKEIKELFKEQIEFLNHKKWWVKKFIKYQYGNLNQSILNKPHQSYIKLLHYHNLYDKYLYSINTLSIDYENSIDSSQDKDKDKDKDKDNTTKVVISTVKSDFDFSNFQSDYIPLLKDFIEYRNTMKHPIKTQKGVNLNYNELYKLSNGDINLAKQIYEQTVGREWQTFYELKKNGTAKQTSITKEELEKANNYLLLKGKEWNE